MDVASLYFDYGLNYFLWLFLPWAGLVVGAAWAVRTSRPRHFLPWAILVWVATSVVVAIRSRSALETVMSSAWVLILLVLPQAILLSLLIRRRARPLTMLIATTLLWIVQLPVAWFGLLLAGCMFLQQCL